MSGSSKRPPGEPRRAERLRHLRLAQYNTSKLHGEGHICHVTEIGMFLRCDELPEIGESVRVTLAEPKPHFVASGTVKSLREDAPNRGFGMEITQSTPRYQALIASLRQPRERRGPEE
jgi:hypothetical protein